jgi:hypothetical protein
MSDILNVSFSHTYNGQETYEILNNAFVAQSGIMKDWTVYQDVVSKRNLYITEGGSKILKPYSSSWNPTASAEPLSDIVLDVEDVEVNMEITRASIKQTALEEITKKGNLRDNLSDTPIFDAIANVVKIGTSNDIFRQVMWNEKTGNSGGSVDYNAFDGLFYSLSSNASVNINLSSDVAIDASSGGLVTDAGLSVFRYLFEHADNKLKVKPSDEKAYYVTPDLYFDFLKTIETGAHDYAKIVLQSGEVQYKFRGIEIVPIWTWASDVLDSSNPFTGTLRSTAKSFAMYTEKKNLVVGTDIGVSNTTLSMEYIMKDKKLYVMYLMKLGANIKSKYNTAIAY